MKKYNEIINYFANIRRVIPILIKASPRLFFLVFLLSVVSGIYPTLFVFVSKYFVDSIIWTIKTSNLTNLLFFLIIQGVLILLSNLTNLLFNYVESIEYDKIDIYINKLLLDKISKLQMIDFDKSEMYDQIEFIHMQSSTQLFSIQKSAFLLIQSFSQIVGYIFIMIQFNIFFSIVCLIVSVPGFLTQMNFSYKKFIVLSKRLPALRLISYLKNLMIEYNAIKEMKVFRLYNYFQKLVMDKLKQHYDEDKFIRRKFLLKTSALTFLQNIMNWLMKLILILKSINKGATVGDIVMYVNTYDGLQMTLKIFLETFISLYSSNLYLNSLFTLLEYETTTERNKVILKQGDFSYIEFKNVSFKYPESDVYTLKDINCIFKAGKSYSLVGLNGSGKTTMVKLLTKLYKPTKGKIVVDGIDLNEITDDSYLIKISTIFQDFLKYPMDVKSNIGLGNVENINDFNLIKKASDNSGATPFILELPNLFDTTLLKEWGGQIDLSLGQWQKIALSRLFFSNAKLFILDEPTASLDAEAEYEMFCNFKNIVNNKTAILISHRLSTVKLVDNILFLENGVILEVGTHEELMLLDGKYAELFKKQAQAYN